MVNGASCSISRLPPIVPAGFGRLLTMRRWPYRTSDGYLCVLIYDDVHWQRFFATIGGPDPMTRDPKFAHCVSRSANIEEIYAELSAIMVSWPTSEWQTLLDAADIQNAPLNTPIRSEERRDGQECVRKSRSRGWAG